VTSSADNNFSLEPSEIEEAFFSEDGDQIDYEASFPNAPSQSNSNYASDSFDTLQSNYTLGISKSETF
jgi:hypothetical protein